MRMAQSTFIALTALALLGAPALAKNTKAQKAESEDASRPCSSYQLAPDGHWEQLPCQETGAHASSHHGASPKSHDGEQR